MFERLLVPIDFSEQSLRMLECTAKFCTQSTESIIALHVMEDNHELAEQQMERLEDLMETMRSRSLNVKFMTATGRPAEEILKKSREEKVTMIAMASSGKGLAREFLVGSVTLEVIRNTEIPVLVNKFEIVENDSEIKIVERCQEILKTALVPIDFSSCTGPVIQSLKSLMERGLKGAVLFHVVDSSKYRLKDDAHFQKVKSDLEKIKDSLMGLPCDVLIHIHFGVPAYNIMEGCREFNCTLILLGTHGKSLLHEMTLGSISEEVIRKAKVPLLIIPCKR